MICFEKTLAMLPARPATLSLLLMLKTQKCPAIGNLVVKRPIVNNQAKNMLSLMILEVHLWQASLNSVGPMWMRTTSL